MWWRKIRPCCAASVVVATALAASTTIAFSEELKVAVFDNWPPDEWAEKGELKGFAVDLVRLVAKELDAEIVMEPTTFDSIIPSLSSGRYQIGVGSFATTKERLTQVDFVTINTSGSGIGLRADDKRQIKVAADLCSLQIGVITGSVDGSELDSISGQSCAGTAPIKTIAFPTPAAAMLALKSNRIDGVASGFSQLRYLESQQSGIRGADYMYKQNYQAWALRKDSDLNPKIVDALNRIIKDGRYSELMKKWNVTEVAIPESVLLTSNSADKDLLVPNGN